MLYAVFILIICAIPGKFCFCGAALPSGGTVADSHCSSPCSGNSTLTCGGTDYVDVYTSSPPIVGLELSAVPSAPNGISVVSVGDDVTFSASYTSSGPGLVFQLDYGDGSGRTGQNDSDMWVTKFYSPGHYQITLSSNDAIGSLVVRSYINYYSFSLTSLSQSDKFRRFIFITVTSTKKNDQTDERN